MQLKVLEKDGKKNLSKLPSRRVAILGDSATQMFCKALRKHGFQEHLNLEIFEADYDQIERQVFDPGSDLYQFQADFVIIFQSTQKLMNKFHRLPKEKQAAFSEDYLSDVKQLWEQIGSRGSGTIIHFNFPESDDNVFGNFANKTPFSFLYQLRKINFSLMEISKDFRNVFINDISLLQNTYGRQNTFDARMYVLSKMVFSLDFLPVVAKNTVDIIKAATGKLKKCLILDLDNTLWGGVIGDDGLNNIEIGELGLGRAFTELQMWAKQLKERGIILTVCSKNTEHIAKEPFEKHPDMVLRLEDIAVFVANWENKADNIKYIQEVLNIGFDSMVFVDDNPMERNLVREMLPDITVPELPEDPAEYMPYLRSLNLFETTSFSDEDVSRTQKYQEEAKRLEYQKKYTSLDDYLQKLEMVSQVKPFDDFDLPRIAQLIQRSNQFNLRTIRYSEHEIQKMRASGDIFTLSFDLKDKFGDYGLIAVLILRAAENALFIDTWIMSCRVLKRDMENFTLNKVAKLAADNGYRKLVGEYIPTSKNGIVKDHYQSLGFTENNGSWELDLAGYEPKKCYIAEEINDYRSSAVASE